MKLEWCLYTNLHSMKSCSIIKICSTFVCELLVGQNKAKNIICKIHVVSLKNGFSGEHLSLALRPESFFPGFLLKGSHLRINGQWLFVALACHGRRGGENNAPALGLST